MAERKTVTVNGEEFPVLTNKLGSWKVFRMLAAARKEEDEYEKAMDMLYIALFITGLSEDEFVEKCGGDDASVAQVLETAATIIAEAYPKN